jgi:NAD(P)H-hydrate epimerase
LAGVTGALLAQGLAPFTAATAAVFLHGRAADTIASSRGQVGLLARDLLAEFPATIAALQRAGHPRP